MHSGRIMVVFLILVVLVSFSTCYVSADPELSALSRETTVSLELRRIEGNFQNILEEMRKGNYHNALLKAQEIADQNLNRDTNLYWIAKFHILNIYMDTKNFSKAIPLIEEELDNKKQILDSDVLALYIARQMGIDNPKFADFYLGCLVGTLFYCYRELGEADEAKSYAERYQTFLKDYRSSLARRKDVSSDDKTRIQGMIDSALAYTEEELKMKENDGP